MHRRFVRGFWRFYEKHYRVHLTITVGLFALQIVHLAWLMLHVILFRLTGTDFFPTGQLASLLLILVDYTEIPALLSTSFLYLYELRARFRWKTVFFLLALNIQWLHLFWITDAFVVGHIHDREATILPGWLAWIAILIDYLEIPVIIDTSFKLVRAWRAKKIKDFLREELKK